jgi:hypothetical protein
MVAVIAAHSTQETTSRCHQSTRMTASARPTRGAKYHHDRTEALPAAPSGEEHSDAHVHAGRHAMLSAFGGCGAWVGPCLSVYMTEHPFPMAPSVSCGSVVRVCSSKDHLARFVRQSNLASGCSHSLALSHEQSHSCQPRRSGASGAPDHRAQAEEHPLSGCVSVRASSGRRVLVPPDYSGSLPERAAQVSARMARTANMASSSHATSHQGIPVVHGRLGSLADLAMSSHQTSTSGHSCG